MTPPISLQSASPEEVLAWALEQFGSRFAVLTSFQLEGMVLLDMAARLSRSVRVVTLDTGRLPTETFDIMERARERYGVTIEMVLPDGVEVERMTARFGPDLFRESVARRRLCCEVRKVRPLARKLTSLDAYAVGLRREQGESRGQIERIAEQDGRWKLSPLAAWTSADVAEYAARHDVLRHELYERGYTSIGCAPCTRAAEPGAGERSGRWWWEDGEAKECGLHFSAEGRAERALDVLLREVVGSTASVGSGMRS